MLFFMVNLLERNQTLLVDHIDLLGDAVRKCKQRHSFYIDAWVILPEHMHCIWTLPENDVDFCPVGNRLKPSFLKDWLAMKGVFLEITLQNYAIRRLSNFFKKHIWFFSFRWKNDTYAMYIAKYMPIVFTENCNP